MTRYVRDHKTSGNTCPTTTNPENTIPQQKSVHTYIGFSSPNSNIATVRISIGLHFRKAYAGTSLGTFRTKIDGTNTKSKAHETEHTNINFIATPDPKMSDKYIYDLSEFVIEGIENCVLFAYKGHLYTAHQLTKMLRADRLWQMIRKSDLKIIQPVCAVDINESPKLAPYCTVFHFPMRVGIHRRTGKKHTGLCLFLKISHARKWVNAYFKE